MALQELEIDDLNRSLNSKLSTGSGLIKQLHNSARVNNNAALSAKVVTIKAAVAAGLAAITGSETLQELRDILATEVDRMQPVVDATIRLDTNQTTIAAMNTDFATAYTDLDALAAASPTDRYLESSKHRKDSAARESTRLASAMASAVTAVDAG